MSSSVILMLLWGPVWGSALHRNSAILQAIQKKLTPFSLTHLRRSQVWRAFGQRMLQAGFECICTRLAKQVTSTSLNNCFTPLV